MKSEILAVLAVAGACASFGVTVTVDKVQQRYPWNGKIDVDYTISCSDGEGALDAANDRLVLTAVDEAVTPAVTNLAKLVAFGPSPLAVGSHRLTWNASGDGLQTVSSDLVLRLEVRHYKPKYLVVNLEGGSTAGSYPVEYWDAPPTTEGGFNADAFKGDKMVFRLIPSGSFTMGSPTTEGDRAAKESQHVVALTKDYYIGLFEVTKKQYFNVMGGTAPNLPDGYRPQGSISYSGVRGSKEGIKWPATNSVDATSFFGKLRAKTGFDFDLPTEAQWEFACRGGTETPYSDGIPAKYADYPTRMATLGRCSEDVGDGKGGFNTTTVVGSYAPNPYGLYDMHGNVVEWCLDRYQETLPDAIDPVGDLSKDRYVLRGGAYSHAASSARSACRTLTDYAHDRGQGAPDYGFMGVRIALTLP